VDKRQLFKLNKNHSLCFNNHVNHTHLEELELYVSSFNLNVGEFVASLYNYDIKKVEVKHQICDEYEFWDEE